VSTLLGLPWAWRHQLVKALLPEQTHSRCSSLLTTITTQHLQSNSPGGGSSVVWANAMTFSWQKRGVHAMLFSAVQVKTPSKNMVGY
jgi:hypothetical protein